MRHWTGDGAEAAPAAAQLPGSQIFVVGGVPVSRVVLVVAPWGTWRKLREGLGQGWGSSDLGVQETWLLLCVRPVLPPASPIRQVLTASPGTQMTPPSSGPC